MMQPKKFFSSGHYAWQGLVYAFTAEQNFRLQIWAAAIVAMAAVWVGFTPFEFVILTLTIVMVLTLELINTSVEKFLDLLAPRLHHQAKIVKDVLAGAVFLASLGSIIIGLLLFLPHL